MRLQTKISMALLPLVALTIFFVGTWAVIKATKGIQNAMYQLIETELKHYVQDTVSDLSQTLEKHGLSHVDSFVQEYQQYALEATKKIDLFKTGHLFVIGKPGEIVFSSRGEKNHGDKYWAETENDIIKKKGEFVRGLHTFDHTEEIYIGYYFDPWKWTIIYAISTKELFAPVKVIRNVTIVAGLICTALSLFLIFFIIQRFVIRPVTLLKDAAVKVAQRRRIEKIPVETADELGTLSRSMENMADDIWNYQKEQENWQSKLEDKIKERTRSLSEAEERYRQVVNTINEAIIIADTNGFLLFVNPSCCEIYRYSEKELIGMHTSNLVHPEYNHVFERFSVEVREKGSFSGETMDVRKDGSHFFTDVRGTLILYNNQECLLAVIRDVTEKKTAEMEREKLIEELQKALNEIKTLKGIVPICSSCKKIRDDKGYWNQIENYIRAHSEAEFSHGICPDCAKELYPEFDLYPETK